MKTMNLEPVWNSMFGLAVQLVKDNYPENRGKDVVVEMLEFGGRLHEAHEECINDHYTFSDDGLISVKEME